MIMEELITAVGRNFEDLKSPIWEVMTESEKVNNLVGDFDVWTA